MQGAYPLPNQRSMRSRMKFGGMFSSKENFIKAVPVYLLCCFSTHTSIHGDA